MKSFPPASVYSGLSGLQLPISKNLYPSQFKNKSRLTYYSSFFNSIEFNSSFYKIPKVSTVAKWAGSVSDTFRFTFKLWKGITHSKEWEFNMTDLNTFFNSINSVTAKKGCLLIQFPPSFSIENTNKLDKLLGCIKAIDPNQEWKIAIEFRNNSCYNINVYDILNSYNSAIVIQDIPKSVTPLLTHKAEFVYIRFHGPTGNYRGSYSTELLNKYSMHISEWVKEGKAIYVYFNNTMGDAFQNLKMLNDLLSDKIVLKQI